MLAGAIYALLYILAAPFVMGILFPKYPESVLISQAIMLMIILNGSLLAAHLDSRMLIREKYFLKVSVALSRVVLLFPCIALFGVWGAVLSQAGTQIIGYLIGNILVIRVLKQERQSLDT